MALDPDPFDLVPRVFLDEALPQVGVGDRLLGCRFPTILLPAEDPFGDAVADIDAVGRQFDVAAAFERGERLDRGHQFHARSEEHTSELQSLMRISYAVFCLKNKT